MNNLKLLRKNKNFSQIQLASELGVSQQAVAKWESGKSTPRADKLFKLAKILNFTVDELISDENL